MIYVPRCFEHNSSHSISERSLQMCEEGRPFSLKTNKAKIINSLNNYNKSNQGLNVLCLPQLIVQEWSWTVSSAGFTIWFSCYLTPVRELPITAAPTTNKSPPQWSLHPALMMTLAWTWTVVCSAPVRMQVTVLSWPWRFLKYAITSGKPILITNHDKKLVGYSKTIPRKVDNF